MTCHLEGGLSYGMLDLSVQQSCQIRFDLRGLVICWSYAGHMQTINASEFKTKCLSILDEVAATGETFTVLKRGKPVAQLVPPVSTASRYPQQELVGTVVLKGDVMDSVLPAEGWNAECGDFDG